MFFSSSSLLHMETFHRLAVVKVLLAEPPRPNAKSFGVE